MTFVGFMKSRRKEALLLFFAGFFIGGILYTLCKDVASGQFDLMGERTVLWAESQVLFFDNLLHVFWERGKKLGLLWLAGGTKYYRGYIRVFLMYVGLQLGFMLLFFLKFRRVGGLLLWLGMMMPHALLLVPLYLYCFYRICEKRQDHSVAAIFLILICFFFSCLLETAGNIPMMQWLIHYL